jgi:hypothetical protein
MYISGPLNQLVFIQTKFWCLPIGLNNENCITQQQKLETPKFSLPDHKSFAPV